MKQYGVIFDMDGVLVDSNDAHYSTFQVMAEKLGRPFPLELWNRSIGMHNAQIFPLWLGDTFEGKPLTPERVQALADEKEALYRERAGATLKPVPGAIDLIKQLHAAGCRLAVGSSGPRQNVALAIKILDVASYFDVVITGHDVKHGKPAPDIFLKAAEGLKLAGSKCLVIEDAPQGVQAALNARIRVAAVTTSRPPEELSAATVVVRALSELDPLRIRALIDG